MSLPPDDPDHWAYQMRRCPLVKCSGVVDDEVVPLRCCSCGEELRDGPGAMPLPSPSGRVFQSDPYRGHPAEPPPRPPANVVSLDACWFCGTREVSVDMGPHRFVVERHGRKIIEHLTYPALTCAACEQSWTDHRAEKIREEATMRLWRELECP